LKQQNIQNTLILSNKTSKYTYLVAASTSKYILLEQRLLKNALYWAKHYIFYVVTAHQNTLSSTKNIKEPLVPAGCQR
jgi:hypothetical protein